MAGPYSSDRSSSLDYATDNTYGRVQTQRKGFRGTEENAKTKLCMRWQAGDCRFGPRCNFAHGHHELRKMPPKPGRHSQEVRERDVDKDLAADASTYVYGSASFDGRYPIMGGRGRSNAFTEYYTGAGGGGNPFPANPGGGGNGYPGHLYGSGSPSLGYGGPSPTMVQPSGPLHVTAAATSGREYYPNHSYFVVGPNGWIMYRDPKSGEPYYHNHQLSITQWKRPDEWPLP